MKRIAIAGAGLAGATLAHALATRNAYDITVFDPRDHVGGNIHSERDAATGIMVHKYGPHIFHTNDASVWRWMGQFGEMMPYTQRTKGVRNGCVYSLPINLHTINQAFGKNMSPEDARRFIADKADGAFRWHDPSNFMEQGLKGVGPELYAMFLHDYTKKQWGRDPRELPASVLKRLPLRFNFNDNAFDHPYQGIPREGYTKAVAAMLDHPNIHLEIGRKLTREMASSYDFTFVSGPLDEWFDYKFGKLAYRTLDISHQTFNCNDYQGCAVLNNCDDAQITPWTRSTEHKHFALWEVCDGKTIVSREYPREHEIGDVHYYPIRLAQDTAQLGQYETHAQGEANTHFIGRLGTYQYLDMDKTILLSLHAAQAFDFHHRA